MSKLQAYDIDAIRAKFLEEQKNKNIVQNEQKEFSPYEEEMKRREEDLRRREEILLQKTKELEEAKQEPLVSDEPKEQIIEDNIDELEKQVTKGDDVGEPELDVESESEGEGESGQETESQSGIKGEQEGAEDSSEEVYAGEHRLQDDQIVKDVQTVVKLKPLRRGVRSATSDINKTTAIRDFPLVLIEEAKSAGFFPTLGTYKDFIIAMCALPLTDMDLSFLPDHIVEAVKAQRKDTRQYTMGEIDEKVSVIGTMCNQMYRSILGIELGTVYLSGSQHLITGQSGNLPKRLSEINYKDQDYVDGVKKLRQDGNDLYNKLRLQVGRPIK